MIRLAHRVFRGPHRMGSGAQANTRSPRRRLSSLPVPQVSPVLSRTMVRRRVAVSPHRQSPAFSQPRVARAFVSATVVKPRHDQELKELRREKLDLDAEVQQEKANVAEAQAKVEELDKEYRSASSPSSKADLKSSLDDAKKRVEDAIKVRDDAMERRKQILSRIEKLESPIQPTGLADYPPGAEFAKALVDAPVIKLGADVEMLRLPTGVSLLGMVEPTSTLFTRASSREIIRHITQAQPRNTLATGSSGVGKSFSSAWLMRWCFQQRKTVVFEARKDNHVYVFEPQGERGYRCSRISTKSYDKSEVDVVPQLEQDGVWYIFDSGGRLNAKEPIFLRHGHTVNFASRDRCHYHEWVKVGAGRLYFPTWTLEELLAIHQHMPHMMTEEEVRERFHQVGGVIGHVFLGESDYFPLLHNQRTDIMELSLEVVQRFIFDGADLEQKDVSGKVFSMWSHSPFTAFKIREASTQVRDILISRIQRIDKQLFSLYLQHAPDHREEYERRIISAIAGGGEFPVRPKDSKDTITSVRLHQTTVKYCPSDDSLRDTFSKEPSVLCVPKRGQPVVDAMCGPDMAFQITTGKSSKKLDVPQLKLLLDMYGFTPERKLKLHIVSPQHETQTMTFSNSKETGDLEYVSDRTSVFFMADEAKIDT